MSHFSRVDGFLSNKAQQVWPTALVYCEEANGKETWKLDKQGGPSPDGFSAQVGLGGSFHDAKQALQAIMKSEREKAKGHKLFPKIPRCEVCKSEPATSLSVICKDGADSWVLAGACTEGREQYYVTFDSMFESPAETVDWIAHLSEKTWFSPREFFSVVRRLRAVTSS